jgi:hypothetical protein
MFGCVNAALRQLKEPTLFGFHAITLLTPVR